MAKLPGKNASEDVILGTVKNATVFLANLSAKGCLNISSDSSEKLQHFSHAFRSWKLVRLSALFDKLRQQLIAVDENSKDYSDFEIAGTISDAIFTCKALKTAYKGRLDDVRVQTALFGLNEKKAGSEKIDNLSLVKVATEYRNNGKKNRYIDEFFMEPEGRGIIYRQETRIEPLKAPPKSSLAQDVTAMMIAERGYLCEGFPPRQIVVTRQSVFPAALDIVSSVAEQATSNYKMIGTIYKAFRSNLFAPEVFYSLIKFNAVYSTEDAVYLVDEHNNMLKIADNTYSGNNLSFLNEIIYEKPEAVFGKVSSRGQDLHFSPLTIIDSTASIPIKFLHKNLHFQGLMKF